MIIDVHAHIGCDQRFCFRMSAKELVRAMDRYGIKCSFISSIKSLVYDYIEGNEDVEKACLEYPKRLFGLVAVNPLYGKEAIEEMTRRLAKEVFIGVKIHPHYFNVPADSPLMNPIVEKAISLRAPLFIHSYDGGVQLENLADRYPDALIVMYHMGGGDWEEGVLRVRRFDNVYVEMSSSFVDVGMVETAVEVLGEQRVLFGSDIPFQSPSISMAKVLEANISDYVKEMIFYRNALELFNLRGKI
ncbi:MAG: hypothetical protein DRJ63_01770 [Thermoprotei archaeon]|nr:MAG: hypothetical protein DRJ63_01770 [Thermoprotei archaeon]